MSDGRGRWPRKPLAERVEAAISPEPTTGCWLWAGAACGGYGNIWDGRPRRAHRVVYELRVGPIPPGLQLDHLCRNTMCVNPRHLEPVTARENNRRSRSPSALNAIKTKCHAGHALSGRNLVVFDGSRACRTCRVEATRRWRAKHAC